MKKIITMAVVSLLALNLVACGSDDGGKQRVGIIQLAEHPALDASYEGFKKALMDEGFNEDNVIFDYQNASGDASNCPTIAEKLVNDGSDLIYAIATPAAQATAQKTKDIPIVLSAVTDPESAGLVKSNKKPGTNVTGTSDLTPVEEQLDLLKQLLPNAKKIAIMYCSAEDNSIFQAKIAEKYAKKLGYETVKATVAESNQIQQVSESLIGKVDAIYIPTDNLLAEGMASVAQVTNANNLPVIVGESGMVNNGGLATYGIDYYALGYQAGLQAAKILKGESKPEDMPIKYTKIEDCKLTINKKAMEQLGIEIPQDILDKATIVE